MSKNTIPLGRILGIPVGLDPSWFLIFALVTWILAASYFPSEFANWPTAQYWIAGAITAVLFFVSVLLHELGHSVVALRYKLPVTKITLFIFGGISQIESEPSSAFSEFLIAFAGPLTSIVLAVIFGLLEAVSTSIAPVFAMAKYLAYINGALAVFNLIPGFPLDGGRVFRAIVWGITHNLRRATEIAATIGRVIAFLFILFGVWQVLQGNWINGLWIAFIGWFLESAASGQLQQQRIHDLLAGHTVAQAMGPSCATAPIDITLRELVDHHILGEGHRYLMLTRGEEIAGLLTLHNLRDVPRDKWETITAGEVMTPLSTVKRITPEEGLEKAFDEMGADGVNQLPVMSDGKVEGMLSREDIINYLRLLQRLGM
ncbi:MAG: site-2 protease family protein [Anaerolineales bacterium]|jgi:Zn-dependent protease/CBS domain-containing protein